jgi:radical SAM protein with 4Fe4S-binding SPASM domain
MGENVPELVFGNARNDRLEDVWKGAPALQEIREGLPHRLTGICAECLLKGTCLGHCIASNYYQSKDLWKPFWYCEQAQKAGLFPQGRLISNKIKNL